MNKIRIKTAVVAIVILFLISSCDKGGNHHPTIIFLPSSTTISFVTKDTTLYRNTIFNVGIMASKTGPDGLLKSFKITKSVNGSADSVILSADLNTVFFTQFYSYSTGDSGNLEHYTFTIGNTEGLYTTIQFTDTVN